MKSNNIFGCIKFKIKNFDIYLIMIKYLNVKCFEEI
jgi:hypothetical protein